MINISDFANTLQDLLNGDYQGESTEVRPVDYHFFVQTFGSNLDSVNSFKYKENILPVFISDQNGSITPIPDVSMSAYTFVVNFYSPATLKDEIYKMFDYLMRNIVGKIIVFKKDENGNAIERGVCNMSIPRDEAINEQMMTQFVEYMGETFNKLIDISETWLLYSFEFYVSSAKTSTSNGDLVFGNDITYTLSFEEPNGTSYTQKLIRNETNNVLENSFNAQQLLKGAFAKSLISATAYTFGLNAYITTNTFWTTLLNYFAQKRFNELTFTLKRDFKIGNNVISQTEEVLVNMSINEPLGDFVSVSLVFALKGDDD